MFGPFAQDLLKAAYRSSSYSLVMLPTPLEPAPATLVEGGRFPE
jgi:hypothetical protein